MAQLITCTPRVIPYQKVIPAAEAAVRINHLNQPNLEPLSAIPGFSLPSPDHLAVVTSKYWGLDGVKLTVGFLDNPSAELRARILSHMNAWSTTANVEFVETGTAEDAQVRINRETMRDPE